MRLLGTWILAGVTIAAAFPQSGADVWEPSPMEAFAQQANTRTAWTIELGRVDHGDVHAVVTALIVEDDTQPSKQIRGVRIDLSSDKASDRIYLDQEAVTRTIKALGEDSDGMARAVSQGRAGRGCFGAAEFWPMYNWPWNKYHELNADYCGSGDEPRLVLTGRHKAPTFSFPGETPDHLAAMLQTGLDRLKSH